MKLRLRARRRVGWAALVLLVCTACERQPSTAEEEIAAELRAMRLAMANQPAAGLAPTFDRDQITTAMAPLRDVLGQLGSSQRDLAERQTTLTQEMRRWTELMVDSMQEQSATQGRELARRLELLEQSMAAQDARHREVEALMQGALDRTADRLEQFLQRLGAMRTGGDSAAQPAAPSPDGSPGQGAAGGGEGMAPAGRDPAQPEPGAAAPGANSSRAPGGGGERKAATDWLWGGLALLAIGVGWSLLRQGRPSRPMATEPDRQVRPEPAATSIGDSEPDEPEVEELWAAAALLGEAIGRLKHSTVVEHVAHQLATGQPAPAGVEQLAGNPAEGDVELGENAFELPDFDDLFVVDDADAEVAQSLAIDAGTDMVDDLAAERPADSPTADGIAWPDLSPPVPPAAAAAMPAVRTMTPATVVWRLPALDPVVAEARVRGLLASDPRVLLTPAPEVHSGTGSLRVSFVLLPGVPAGERSLLEQRLRDIVA